MVRLPLPRSLLALVLFVPILAGCLSSGTEPLEDGDGAAADTPPFLGYLPAEPDLAVALEELDVFLDGADGVAIHARVVKPEGSGPFPVIVQFTPYTGSGQNVAAQNARRGVEPSVCATPAGAACVADDTFARQFVRRGYAFAYADVRGTGDSSGCLDLRGEGDIDDSAKLIEALGTAPWSNGAVGYIGASYPGSEAHMAALAAAKHSVPYLKAVVPVVASTSFYHYHHNDGVPYNGNHALGGTNAGYTQNALTPTVSPHTDGYALRTAGEAMCPHKENIVDHGGLDQSGSYYDWWQERNLRARAGAVDVPVLMGQGLADWNVKPDHIATWFNELATNKTLIAGQWPHQYPRSASKDCETFTTPPPAMAGAAPPPPCDPAVPYGQWWEYVTAFFDTHLKGLDTGMFGTNVAWVQDNEGTWHRSANWPLLPEEREELVLHLTDAGLLAPAGATADGRFAWKACGRDQMNMGTALATVEERTSPECYAQGANTEIVFESAPLDRDVFLSGVPLLDLVLESTADRTHVVAVLDVLDSSGAVLDSNVSYADGARQNYGYLNPEFRNGLESPGAITAGTAYNVTVDFYPQEDVLRAGYRLRLTLRSHDDGRTIEFFPQGENSVLFGPANLNTLTLPVRPAALQGVRLPPPPEAVPGEPAAS